MASNKLTVNSKVRTLETRIIPSKNAPEGANFVNGAGIGTIVEPEKLLRLVENDEESQNLILNIKSLLAA